MRLIDADELITIEIDEAEPPFRFVPAEFIEAAPTIDAVPVVRCRECRYSREPNRAFRDESVACDGVLVCCAGFEHVHPTSDDGVIFVDADGFCSDGKRREDGDGDVV